MKKEFITVNGRKYEMKKSKFATNKSPLHVSDNMTGKMHGFPSVSTSCLVNPICIERVKNKESVCSHCFAVVTQNHYQALRTATENNFYLLQDVLPLDLLPRFKEDVKQARIESFGDVASVNQAINYLNLCKVNDHVSFAAWTKNAAIWNAAIRIAGKPENLSLVYSSFKMNQPAAVKEFFDGPINNFNHVFTVFDKPTADFYGDHFINCGARNCLSCGRCYRKEEKDFSVRELLK